MQLTEPVEVPVVDAGEEAARRGSEPRLLALEVAARLLRRRLLGDADLVELRVPGAVSKPIDDAGRRDPEHEHRREHRPALLRVLRQLAERVGQRERDHEEEEDLEEVGEAVGVLERVGGVRVEEAAAVGAELLDRLLARDGTARDLLRRALHRVHRGVARGSSG